MLRDLKMTKRPLSHHSLHSNDMLWNIIWSDPAVEKHMDSFGVHSSPRDDHSQIVKTFGKDITADFCNRNGLTMIVRSHQVFRHGRGCEVVHDGRVVQVFTARDYEGFQNDGSVLDIQRNVSTGNLVAKTRVLLSTTKDQPFDSDVRMQVQSIDGMDSYSAAI